MTKAIVAQPDGIEPPPVNAALYPFQRDIVRWALRRGRAAIFAECGLGKTPMQLEWAKAILRHTNRPVLILAPLAVAKQTVREGQKFGVEVHYVRGGGEIKGPAIYIANYEMLPRFDPSVFSGVVLDESSILKSYMGKTKRALLSAFENTPFRLACTATPAPNDHLELGNHSEFLGVLPANRMLSRWFINDTSQAGCYRLKRHAERDYWRWVASWATCIGRPSDLGYDDDGFILPPLNWHEHVVDCSDLPPEDGSFLRSTILSSTDLFREMRQTAGHRATEAARIVARAPEEPWLVWVNTNAEADALRAASHDFVEIRGNESPEAKEEKLEAFTNGEILRLVTKPSIGGFGLNWQHCHQTIFLGLTYSYEQLYQAVRRVWRFGQQQPVEAHVVISDSEAGVLASIREKEAAHEQMRKGMIGAMREFTQQEMRGTPAPAIEYREDVHEEPSFTLYLGDCVQVMRERIKDESVGFSIFSPPFANLYIYSDMPEDMGNCEDDEQFMRQHEFMVRELYRITKPGRLCAVHCKDLVMYQNRDGAAGLRDFPGELTRQFQRCGWVYHSKVTIWKDPVTEMQRTKAHGLLHKQLCKDSTFSRQGLPDYLIIFRKWSGENIDPVRGDHAHFRFDYYVGQDAPKSTDPRAYSIQVWQRYASPVWFDINPMRVLNVKMARDDRDEKHICPLQLDVIERAIHLWSNPGDVVFSPFAGIGSEGYGALLHGRKFVGVELKESYWRHAIENLRAARHEAAQEDLISLAEASE